jgi:hypothetical protein
VWIPEPNDLEGLDEVLRTYLERNERIDGQAWDARDYVLGDFRCYDREFGGFVRDGSRYVICNMIDLGGMQGSAYAEEYGSGSRFSIIMDGGWAIVRVIFDLETRTVIHVECNGWA